MVKSYRAKSFNKFFSLSSPTGSVCLVIFCRLCNTIMFGMGPTDDPRDGVSLDDVVSDENSSAKSDSSVDEK